jgi:hypothetical protein
MLEVTFQRLKENYPNLIKYEKIKKTHCLTFDRVESTMTLASEF